MPVPTGSAYLVCVGCNASVDISDDVESSITYKIEFNNLDSYLLNTGGSKKKDQEATEGPIAEKTCPKCNYHEMSYATAQLRSADEGQTIFYTCVRCRFKFTENS